jgi:hypothetical protein
MTGKDPMASLALRSGIEDNLLRKPFGPGTFLDAVARMLGRTLHAGRTSA